MNKCITKVLERERRIAKSGGKGAKEAAAKFGKFGKLARGAGWLVGWADIPIELAFALPSLLAGDVEGAKRATTFGWIGGWGGERLDKIDREENPEAYKYFKHIQDIKTWMDAYNQEQKAASDWSKLGKPWIDEYKKSGDKSGYTDKIIDSYEEALAIQKEIGENYVGYKTPEGEEDWNAQRIAKEKAKDFLRDETAKEWEAGMDIDISMPDALPGGVKFNWAPFKPNEITSLEQQVEQKGEPYYGKWWKRGVRHKAEELGAEDFFDDWSDAFYGRDVREAYSDLPLEWSGQLANLEEKELYQGLADKLMRPGGAELKQSLIEQGFDMDKFAEYGLPTTSYVTRAQGGIADLLKK